ncbi:thiol-disulfide oxidoreductase DCC family protein [Thalassotalea litorea]|uniref:thiol-disulfide oxidoreductase DCC family protein n=1 Tax=Thalassotalea litorea TaxID=2020715 RepID=UPI0037361436
MKLTIFYDGQCPLCLQEMRALQRKNTENLIYFIDINRVDFSELYPHIDLQKARSILHGEDENNKLLLGLDVTYKAWALVGERWRVAPLRWPILRPVADKAYLVFAKNRFNISRWLTGQERLDCSQCADLNKSK